MRLMSSCGTTIFSNALLGMAAGARAPASRCAPGPNRIGVLRPPAGPLPCFYCTTGGALCKAEDVNPGKDVELAADRAVEQLDPDLIAMGQGQRPDVIEVLLGHDGAVGGHEVGVDV